MQFLETPYMHSTWTSSFKAIMDSVLLQDACHSKDGVRHAWTLQEFMSASSSSSPQQPTPTNKTPPPPPPPTPTPNKPLPQAPPIIHTQRHKAHKAQKCHSSTANAEKHPQPHHSLHNYLPHPHHLRPPRRRRRRRPAAAAAAQQRQSSKNELRNGFRFCYSEYESGAGAPSSSVPVAATRWGEG